MVSTLHEMALDESIISYGEKLPLVSGSWDLRTGFWWNSLKTFMNESRDVADWRSTLRDGTLAKHLSDFLHREEGAQGSDSIDKKILARKLAQKLAQDAKLKRTCV